MKTCPRCEIPLDESLAGGVSVDGCHGCGGVWFDSGELGGVAGGDPAQLAALEDCFRPSVVGAAPPAASCPACHTAMFTFEFPHSPGIPLDACPQCKGVWADEGELQAIHARILGAQTDARAARILPLASIQQKARQALGFLTSLTCPHCAELNPTTALVCWACGGAIKGQRIALCPVCSVPMAHKFYGTVRADVCECCASIWLDRGELSALLRLDGADRDRLTEDTADPAVDARAAARPTQVLCPACSEPLTEQRYAYDSDVQLDVCAACNGVWLGQGELQAALAHFRHAHTKGRVS